jgi:hypothetical protein
MIVTTLLIHTAMLGFMVFFVAVVSPSALKSLDMASASKFLRYTFPRIFAFGFVVATVATLTAFLAPPNSARLISLISAFFFLINWLVLTPKINTQRDLSLAGDEVAKASFGRLHGVSVGLYLLQMMGSAAVIWMLSNSVSAA